VEPASRPAEITSRKFGALGSFASAQTFTRRFRAAGRPPSTSGRMPDATFSVRFGRWRLTYIEVNSLTDQQLLRDYTGRRSEAAFAELVRRHVDFVYSAAVRMVRDPHLAEDVTQAVFVALAQNARQLADRPVLSGWLHRTAQNLAANAVRSTVRRRAREQEAAAMNELLAHESDAVWEHIAPHLDAALGELAEPDRDALLLRYFERKSAREMALTLGVSEDVAQKRVSRAVERLREFFAKRGVTIGAGGLVVLITANAVQAAPAGLVAMISAAAALVGTTIQTSTAIATTKATALAAAVSTGIYQAHQASTLRSQVQTLQQEQAPLTGQIEQLTRERDEATNRLTVLAGEIAKVKDNNVELLRLRGESMKWLQDSKELARIKAALSQTNKDTSEAQSNLLDSVMAINKLQMTNSALETVAGLKKKLGLTSGQEQQIESILLHYIEPAAQIEMSRLTGGQSYEDVSRQLKQLAAEQDAQIIALLDPDQRTTYQESKKEQAADAATGFARREASEMGGYLQLSPEQSQAVISILAGLPAGQGGSGYATDATSTKAQLEIRLQALATILTPDQLQAYRQKKLAAIEEAALGMQIFKMFKPAAK
jgi:RNA polymerase sigma factor (sigma-70 family)